MADTPVMRLLRLAPVLCLLVGLAACGNSVSNAVEQTGEAVAESSEAPPIASTTSQAPRTSSTTLPTTTTTKTTLPEPSDEPQLCVNTYTLGSTEWDLDATNHLLTACEDGMPISTTSWCCGMGEFFGAIDSNGDGIEEVFVGGTSVAGGGGGMYSLVDGELAAIRTETGEELQLFSGDVGGSFGEYGCRDGLFVQVEIMADGTAAWATRTFYRIDGHSAVIADEERIEWTLADPVAEQGRGGAIWDVYESAPGETVNDLLSCAIPD